MNFAELRFWEILFLGLGIIVLVKAIMSRGASHAAPGIDPFALTLLNLFMLFEVSWTTFTIFLVVTLTTFFGLRGVQRCHSRSMAGVLLAVLIPLQLLPLAYYKYADFAVNDMCGAQFDVLRDLIIPAGISFYSFQVVAFAIDTLSRSKPLPRFIDFMNFAGFFPQVVAGPIERREKLLPQISNFRFKWNTSDVDVGLRWLVIGIFFKLCLAENFALFFREVPQDNPFLVWLQNLLFGFRIYYDFAGYSLVALGIARCLGIRLTLNFVSPYCSTSVAEFWRRWHISLSQWFRDYVYIPLRGNRTRWWALNLMVVFVVSGIWHGAGWNFMIWGAMHGVLLVTYRLTKDRMALPRFLSWAATMSVCFYSWLAFYETHPAALFAKLATTISPTAYTLDALHAAARFYLPTEGFTILCLLLLTGVAQALEWLSLVRTGAPYLYFRRTEVLCLLVVLTFWLSPTKTNEFIYFAF